MGNCPSGLLSSGELSEWGIVLDSGVTCAMGVMCTMGVSCTINKNLYLTQERIMEMNDSIMSTMDYRKALTLCHHYNCRGCLMFHYHYTRNTSNIISLF